MAKFELIKFKNGELELDVNDSPNENTVYLSLDEMTVLFGRDKSVISRHIKNVFIQDNLDENQVVAKNATTAADGKTYIVSYYSLDVIIPVGYRVHSKNGVIFRRWANSVLKEYLLKGAAINDKRLYGLNKTIDIQSKIIASVYEKSAQRTWSWNY